MLVVVLHRKARSHGEQVRVEIEKRLEVLRGKGEPVTLGELAKLYPDPPLENDAGRLLKATLEALRASDSETNANFFLSDKRFQARTEPLPNDLLEAMRVWLEHRQSTLAAFPWDELQGSWIGAGFREGSGDINTIPSGITELAGVLCVVAVLEAEAGNQSNAVFLVKQALQVGNSLKNSVPLHCFVRTATRYYVCQALERIINRTSLPETSLKELQSSLPSEDLAVVREFMINERSFGVFTAQSLQVQALTMTSGARSPATRLFKAYQARLWYHDEDLLEFLKWSDQVRAALNTPASNAIPLLKAMEQERNDPKHLRVSSFDAFRSRRVSLMRLHEPNVSEFLGVLKGFSRTRAAIVAFALERWRLANAGQLPASLSELVPDYLPVVPADPYDDQPLRYRQLPRGYVVYSIGPDFTDDGGKEQSAKMKEGEPYDITFTIER
ncbi:MAG: hypothetical protein IH623_05385 [Verrucomicrobia bacterium]|nr:hypothetical protein [Verrucomicrobiota bacterium]